MFLAASLPANTLQWGLERALIVKYFFAQDIKAFSVSEKKDTIK